MKKKIGQLTQHPATRIGVFLITLVMLAVLWVYRDSELASGKYGYLGIFLINFISSATIFFPGPGFASVFIAGAIFQPWIVSIVSALGATGGELFGYLLGYGGEKLLGDSPRAHLWMKRIRRWFTKAGFITIFLFAALPLPFFDIMGILSGSLNYPIWRFALATFLGKCVKYGVLAIAGQQIIPN